MFHAKDIRIKEYPSFGSDSMLAQEDIRIELAQSFTELLFSNDDNFSYENIF